MMPAYVLVNVAQYSVFMTQKHTTWVIRVLMGGGCHISIAEVPLTLWPEILTSAAAFLMV